MSFAGKPLVKIPFGPLQSYSYAENIQTMTNIEWYNVLFRIVCGELKYSHIPVENCKKKFFLKHAFYKP